MLHVAILLTYTKAPLASKADDQERQGNDSVVHMQERRSVLAKTSVLHTAHLRKHDLYDIWTSF